MIEDGDFDDDMAVRGHFKRILWHEVATRAEDEDKRIQLQQSSIHTVFQTDEEIIEELNKSTFSQKHPNCVSLKMSAAQRYFNEQMASKQAQ
jgi:hypothetical protein